MKRHAHRQRPPWITAAELFLFAAYLLALLALFTGVKP